VDGLTAAEVAAVATGVLGHAVSARLLEEKDRNQVFAVGDAAIVKA
jgi:hypothetical protein